MAKDKQNAKWKMISTAAQSFMILVLIVLVIIQRTIFSIRITRMNKQLEKKAYLDVHTGLANKSCCEKYFYDDQFILNFSRLLRDSVPEQDFVGRYGGDEFMAILFHASNEKISEVNTKLAKEVKQFNKLHHGDNSVDIEYAYGWAFSENYKQCTFRTLFDKADKNMYQNKMESKGIVRK